MKSKLDGSGHRVAANARYSAAIISRSRPQSPPAEFPAGNLTGAPIRIIISPRLAMRRPSRRIFQTPSIRIGTIGTFKFSASSPTPL